MENLEKKEKNNLYIYILFIFFVVFISIGTFLFINSKNLLKNNREITSTSKLNNEKTLLLTPTSILVSKSGFLKLKAEKNQASIEEDVNLDIIADSANQNITAYDVLLIYDPLAFDFIKAVSLDQNFQIYSYKKNNKITFTVVKTNQNLVTSIFRGTPVINLIFKSKKAGQYKFEILTSYNNENTKFVNDKTEVFYPEVNSVNLMVK